MSQESLSMKSPSNTSESSSSSNQLLMMKDNGSGDLALFGTPATVFSRTGTVRRASSTVVKRENSEEEQQESVVRPERFRKSLDSTYRLSLESISEYKPKTTFSSTCSLYPSRDCSSMESSSSECTDFALRSTTTDAKDDKTLMSPASSYLSWIESVNSEYFSSSSATTTAGDVDGKVGEWNNFWLNYSSARSKYMSSPYLSMTEDRTGDDLSDGKSTCSTQREFTEKNSMEQIILSIEEINEAIKCSQRITDILQNALKRNNEQDFEDSNYSQPFSQQNSIRDETAPTLVRDRPFNYFVDAQELQKQKQMLKPTPQSTSSSCINALLNTGVADILKRVITKRREVFSTSEDLSTRSSISEWSLTK